MAWIQKTWNVLVLCVAALEGNQRRYERLGRLKLRLKSNIVQHVALCAAPLSAAGTQTTSSYCLDIKVIFVHDG